MIINGIKALSLSVKPIDNKLSEPRDKTNQGRISARGWCENRGAFLPKIATLDLSVACPGDYVPLIHSHIGVARMII